MKIAVAGATGFIGSHTVRRLLNDHRVVILKRSSSNTSRIADLLSKATCYDLDQITPRDIFAKERPDAVINLATDYGRGVGNASDRQCFNNIVFPLELAEAAAAEQVKSYWNADSYWNTDQGLSRAINLYAYTKQVTKEILRYQLSSRIQIINLKFFHIFGEQDNPTKFLAYAIRSLAANEPLEMTKGSQKLDFTYVKEASEMLGFLANNLDHYKKTYEEFEIGTGQTRTLRSVIELLHKSLKSKSELEFGKVSLRPNEIMEAKAKPQRLLKDGYHSVYSFEDGVQALVREAGDKAGRAD